MTSLEKPRISVIIPCRNEGDWIARCLESIVRTEYPKDRLEVLVVDGMSSDGTRQAVADYAARYPFVRLLDNPRQITPAALNIGLAAAGGEIVMRMDAHYEYADNYIPALADWLARSGADNVGGVLIFRPANSSPLARAIAVAVAHRFGIGNAYYRLGTAEPRWVDTVAFGCYRREVFQRIGGFDETMVRNQDIELNRRLTRQGGRILLVPEVVVYGHARGSLGKLARMYFQYGYFNPLVIWKSRSRVTSRQIVTPAFALSLLTAAALAPWIPAMRWLLAVVLVVYALPVLLFSTIAAVRYGLRCGLALAVVFPTLHLSHGLGFLKGFFDVFVLRKNLSASATSIPLSR
jgi:glycosyltransferase involved in cell wall biosynthesis